MIQPLARYIPQFGYNLRNCAHHVTFNRIDFWCASTTAAEAARIRPRGRCLDSRTSWRCDVVHTFIYHVKAFLVVDKLLSVDTARFLCTHSAQRMFIARIEDTYNNDKQLDNNNKRENWVKCHRNLSQKDIISNHINGGLKAKSPETGDKCACRLRK